MSEGGCRGGEGGVDGVRVISSVGRENKREIGEGEELERRRTEGIEGRKKRDREEKHF